MTPGNLGEEAGCFPACDWRARCDSKNDGHTLRRLECAGMISSSGLFPAGSMLRYFADLPVASAAFRMRSVDFGRVRHPPFPSVAYAPRFFVGLKTEHATSPIEPSAAFVGCTMACALSLDYPQVCALTANAKRVVPMVAARAIEMPTTWARVAGSRGVRIQDGMGIVSVRPNVHDTGFATGADRRSVATNVNGGRGPSSPT